MSKKNKHYPSAMLTRLPFRSILNERPAKNEWVLIAWQMDGYVGFESIFWDTLNPMCQSTVMWLPLYKDDASMTVARAIKQKKMATMPLLEWSDHFSTAIGDSYCPKSLLPKKAATI